MTSAEGHDCWESCDEGPHGCVCGNKCEPPRSTIERIGGRQLIPAEHVADPATAHQAIALHLEAVLKSLHEAGADLHTLALSVGKVDPRTIETRFGHEEGAALVVRFSALPLPREPRVA